VNNTGSKRILYAFVIPLALILVSIYYLNRFNKNEIKSQFEKITISEGVTIRELVEKSGASLAQKGEANLTAFLDQLYRNESIIYTGLFKNGQLIYLLSRFEGYFPIVDQQQDFRIMDSPVGKIFEITASFTLPAREYRLYIGFNYHFLDVFEEAASRNFLMVAGLFSLIILAVISLVIYFDRRSFQENLQLAREKQEKERFKELALLTSEIAHEIKNPLNSIYLSFNTLEQHCASHPEALFYRTAIKNEIKRISNILQSYSDLSKKIQPHPRVFRLEDFAREFKLLMEEEVKTKQIDFQVTWSGKESIAADENLLKQMVLNLVKNSMEAGASVISAAFNASAGQLVIDVADNGKGIDDEQKNAVFKPYISTKTRGMGLGLYVTRRLAEALNGDIRLLSHEPGNTLFRVTIPGETQ
jgi:signal transduction histidine kinase